MVKLNAKGTDILPNGGQLTGSVMQAAETFTNSIEPFPPRGWRKKYNSPVSGVDPVTDSGCEGTSVAAGTASGVWPKAWVGVTGAESKKEAGVGVGEHAARKIKTRA